MCVCVCVQNRLTMQLACPLPLARLRPPDPRHTPPVQHDRRRILTVEGEEEEGRAKRPPASSSIPASLGYHRTSEG